VSWRGRRPRETIRGRAEQATARAPIPLANRIRNESDSATAWMYRTYLLYFKGPCLLNSVREQIGDQAFLVFLRSCQATLEWKFGSTQTVEKVLEAVTKKDWKQVFDADYWGTGMPEKQRPRRPAAASAGCGRASEKRSSSWRARPGVISQGRGDRPASRG